MSEEGDLTRVILATDGDFNVGASSQGELVRLIEQRREAHLTDKNGQVKVDAGRGQCP